MQQTDLEALKEAIRSNWSPTPGEKARHYVGNFFSQLRMGRKISAQVRGNHGIYTISIEAKGQSIDSACSCYIGKGGYCHHCQALAITFLNDPGSFKEVEQKKVKQVRTLADLPVYLSGVTLDSLLKDLKAHGITQKAFAEAIGMSSQHLAAVKSSELRHHYFHELGATKLACLWVLEHCKKVE
jgi:hypothetical protein